MTAINRHPFLRCLAGVAAVLALTAAKAPDYRIAPASLPLLPGRTLKGEQIAVPGTVIAESPLGRPETALLVDPITLDRPGQKRVFTRETVFEAARVEGIPGDPPVLFCESELALLAARATAGSPASRLDAAGQSAAPVARYCLYDSDNDEKLDHALLIGAKADSSQPFAITPARYGLISGMPLGGDSELRLRYAGAAGEKDSLSFDAELVVKGVNRPLPGARHQISIAHLPAYGIIEGAVVTVLEFDAKTKIARVRIDRDLAPGRLVVPEQKP